MENEEVVSVEAAAEVQVETPAEETKTEETVVEEVEEPVEVAIPEPKKKTAQERIDEITKARREAEREREYWKRVALEKGREPVEKEVPATPAIPQRPTLEQFDTTVEYEDALFNWYETKKTVEQTVSRQRTENEEAFRKFNQRAEKLRKEYEDFDMVIETPVFSEVMRNTLLRAENGPLLAYHLGSPENRDTVERIKTLPPELQIYEIGKLETKLLLAHQTKKSTSAPAPITPVGISGNSEEDPGKMTTEEWMKWDKQRTLDKLKAKYG